MLKTIFDDHITLVYESATLAVNVLAIAWPFLLLALIPLFLVWRARKS